MARTTFLSQGLGEEASGAGNYLARYFTGEEAGRIAGGR